MGGADGEGAIAAVRLWPPEPTRVSLLQTATHGVVGGGGVAAVATVAEAEAVVVAAAAADVVGRGDGGSSGKHP